MSELHLESFTKLKASLIKLIGQGCSFELFFLNFIWIWHDETKTIGSLKYSTFKLPYPKQQQLYNFRLVDDFRLQERSIPDDLLLRKQQRFQKSKPLRSWIQWGLYSSFRSWRWRDWLASTDVVGFPQRSKRRGNSKFRRVWFIEVIPFLYAERVGALPGYFGGCWCL